MDAQFPFYAAHRCLQDAAAWLKDRLLPEDERECPSIEDCMDAALAEIDKAEQVLHEAGFDFHDGGVDPVTGQSMSAYVPCMDAPDVVEAHAEVVKLRQLVVGQPNVDVVREAISKAESLIAVGFAARFARDKELYDDYMENCPF